MLQSVRLVVHAAGRGRRAARRAASRPASLCPVNPHNLLFAISFILPFMFAVETETFNDTVVKKRVSSAFRPCLQLLFHGTGTEISDRPPPLPCRIPGNQLAEGVHRTVS